MLNQLYKAIIDTSTRELKRMLSRPIYFITIILVMAFCFVFFLTLFSEGQPNKMPIAVVDLDNSSISRQIVRNMDATQKASVIMKLNSHKEAREEMQRGNIYGFVEIKRDFELNVFSGWRLCQLTVPYMKKDGYGSIVFTTSMSSVNKSPNMSGYGGSKAAVNHTVANLAHDFGPEVRINAVGPGATRTAALESVLTPEIEKIMLANTPIKRLGTAEDIAGAMLYFAAPISEWVSGQTIFVNGGGEQTLE